MDRRRFVKAGATAAALGFGGPGHASEKSWKQAFASALTERPWLLGYSNADRPRWRTDNVTVNGRLPAALNGTLYRNGPARHEIGNFRYHHWFDGDGMMQAYQIADGRVRHTARMVDTFKYVEEHAAGRALYPGFGTVPPNPKGVTSPDSVNVANISVLHHHGKLLALWEAGSPWELDPVTLGTRGRYEFSPETAGVPFSAHPRVEPDGTLWNFGYLSTTKTMVFWHIDKTGRLKNIQTLKVDPFSMPHDFIVTERHLLIMIPPLHFEPTEQGAFLDLHHWRPEQPARLLVANKNDINDHFWLELPAQWVFHYGNAWEDNDGVIRFDAARAPDPSLMFDTFRQLMRGAAVPGAGARHTAYRVDTKNRSVEESPLLPDDIESEFPVVDPRVMGREYRRVITLSADRNALSPSGALSRVSSLDIVTGTTESYRYPDYMIPEEHLFVPMPGSPTETAGWVVGTALNWRDRRTELNVFDVDHLSDGPIASALLPYHLPLGLHGKFVA